MRQPRSSYGFGCVVLLTLLFWFCACTRNVVAQVGAVASAGGVTAVAQVPDFGANFNVGSFVPQVPFFNGGQQPPFPRRPPPPPPPPPPPYFDRIPGNGFNGYGPPFNPNINGFLQNMPFGNMFPNFQYPNQPQWNNNNQFPHQNHGHHHPHPNRQHHQNQHHNNHHNNQHNNHHYKPHQNQEQQNKPLPNNGNHEVTHEPLKVPPGAFIYPDSSRYVHIPDTNPPTEIDPRR